MVPESALVSNADRIAAIIKALARGIERVGLEADSSLAKLAGREDVAEDLGRIAAGVLFTDHRDLLLSDVRPELALEQLPELDSVKVRRWPWWEKDQRVSETHGWFHLCLTTEALTAQQIADFLFAAKTFALRGTLRSLAKIEAALFLASRDRGKKVNDAVRRTQVLFPLSSPPNRSASFPSFRLVGDDNILEDCPRDQVLSAKTVVVTVHGDPKPYRRGK